MTVWHDEQSIKKVWRDADQIDAEELSELLEVAREECEAFAYAADVKDPTNIPTRVRLAQRLHAQAIWRSWNTNGRDDTNDLSGQSVTVYPMDWQVKNHLRPKQGVPVVG